MAEKYSARMMREGLAAPVGQQRPTAKAVKASGDSVQSPRLEANGPYISFSIEKKVGDAKIHASGPLEALPAARKAISNAVRKVSDK